MARGFMDGYKTYDTSTGYGSASQWRKSFYKKMSSDEADAILNNDEQDPWEILGAKRGMSRKEITQCMRKMVMKWHPDVCKDPRAEEMTKKIIAAYTKLTGG